MFNLADKIDHETYKKIAEKIKYLLNNLLEKNQICNAAKQVISENQGATIRNLEILKDIYAKVPL